MWIFSLHSAAVAEADNVVVEADVGAVVGADVVAAVHAAARAPQPAVADC